MPELGRRTRAPLTSAPEAVARRATGVVVAVVRQPASATTGEAGVFEHDLVIARFLNLDSGLLLAGRGCQHDGLSLESDKREPRRRGRAQCSPSSSASIA